MTDFLDRLERQLIDAAAAPAGQLQPVVRHARDHDQAARRGPHRARLARARRWRPLVLLLVLCVAGAIAALAAGGVLKGALPAAVDGPPSFPAYAGVAAAGSVLVLALRVEGRPGSWSVTRLGAAAPVGGLLDRGRPATVKAPLR
jgi:hypothetical protein